MNLDEANIVLSLVRCANNNPTLATRHQMFRLISLLQSQNDDISKYMVDKLTNILSEGPYRQIRLVRS